MPEEYISTGRAAEILGMSISGLGHWRRKKFGPSFYLMGGRVKYRREEVLRFRDSVWIECQGAGK